MVGQDVEVAIVPVFWVKATDPQEERPVDREDCTEEDRRTPGLGDVLPGVTITVGLVNLVFGKRAPQEAQHLQPQIGHRIGLQAIHQHPISLGTR